MVDNNKMNGQELLSKLLEEGSGDLLRDMLQNMAQALMSADASAQCGAELHERSDARVNSRNGYRTRRWDTRAGTIELAIPKLRTGCYFPDWLLDKRRRAERAMTAVIAESYLKGVSTRRVDKLVKTMGIEGISKSQVSELAKSLDDMVDAFRNRRLDSASYRYVWMDALNIKCREDNIVINVACLVAVGVNADGRREVLGLDVVTTEDGAGWLSFLRSLAARGLTGVELVISDAHQGLVNAIGSVLVGASWQRCRTHFLRNLLTRVPKKANAMVATLVRTIFSQSEPHSPRDTHRAVVDKLVESGLQRAADMLDEAGTDILAFSDFPRNHWAQIWSNNPQERLNKELRRRTDVVGIFPNRAAVIRLVGAVLAEQNDEWVESRRYMSPEVLKVARQSSATAQAGDCEEAKQLT